MKNDFRPHFCIVENGKKSIENSCQLADAADFKENGDGINTYTVRIRFQTEIYGTFHQTVLFDFELRPYLVRKLQVDVFRTKQEQKEINNMRSLSPGNKNEIIPFGPVDSFGNCAFEDLVKDITLNTDEVSSQIAHELTIDNYKSVMKKFLELEMGKQKSILDGCAFVLRNGS